MSALSIIPSLFWPDAAPRPESPGVQVCAQEIGALERELTTRAGSALAEGSARGLPAFLAAWDRRYVDLGDCGPLESTRKELGELRGEVERLLRSYAEGPMKRQDRIRQAIETADHRASAGALEGDPAATKDPR
jgi:hypothetical protein